MLDEKRVLCIGVGNMQNAPHIIASLAQFHPEPGLELTLFDANEERLDLVDRFCREIFTEHNKTATILSRSDLMEAVKPGQSVILNLHDDCARRMVGKNMMHVFDGEIETGPNLTLSRGDMNRPTKPEHLSEATKKMLLVPDDNLSKEDAIHQALEQFFEVLEEKSIELMPSLNLSLDLQMEAWGWENLSWPEQTSEEQMRGVPFQILRWIHGEDQVYQLMEETSQGPLLDWLKTSVN